MVATNQLEDWVQLQKAVPCPSHFCSSSLFACSILRSSSPDALDHESRRSSLLAIGGGATERS